MQLGEEVQSVVNLQVAGRRVNLAYFVAAVHNLLDGVDGCLNQRAARGEQVVEVAVPGLEHRRGGVAVLPFYGNGGVEAYCCGQCAGVALLGVDVGAVGVGVDLQQTVEELGREVEAHCCALHAALLDDTLVVGVRGADAVGEPARGAGGAERVVLREGCAQGLFLPVGVTACEHAQDAFVVGVNLVNEGAELCAIHHVKGLAGGVDVPVGGKVDFGFAARAFLGGDDDDAV